MSHREDSVIFMTLANFQEANTQKLLALSFNIQAIENMGSNTSCKVDSFQNPEMEEKLND